LNPANIPAASGAADSGFDSLNRTRKKPKFYPGQARPKPPPGPGSLAPVISRAPLRLSIPPAETANKAPIPPAMAGTGVTRRVLADVPHHRGAGHRSLP